ncbi:thymidylate kinase [Hydrogenispora ethanolica]|jgi:thymidylate kinase|uniref:Thymidylate kinase n=1 Tax=Hydrogenispora ethanolica TaxID=1082276 RepID=A0A4R1QP89_HYDET|nr:thymidylate kinase [Hydrogenispora ethanolica]
MRENHPGQTVGRVFERARLCGGVNPGAGHLVGRGDSESDFIPNREEWHPRTEPDLAFLLDIETKQGMSRIQDRSRSGRQTVDRIEVRGAEFQAKVRRGFLEAL